MKYGLTLIAIVSVLAAFIFAHNRWFTPDQTDKIIYEDTEFMVTEKIIYKLKWPHTLSMQLDYSENGYLSISKICVNFLFKKDQCRKAQLEQPIPIQMQYRYNKLSVGDSYIIEFVNNEGSKSYEVDDDRSYYASFINNFLFLGEEEFNCVYNTHSNDRQILIEKCVDPKYIIAD